MHTRVILIHDIHGDHDHDHLIKPFNIQVTLPLTLALAPVTQEDDMRWNPNDDGIVSNP